MTLQQLRALCMIVDQGMHVSSAATTLHRSQPALTRQLQALERDLGADIFQRKRNRIVELTPVGRDILAVARRVVGEADTLRSVAADANAADRGELTLATTHTQARYTLPPVIRTYMQRHPLVSLALRQGTPARCAEMVARGIADFAICTELSSPPADVAQVPCYLVHRSIVTRPRHPLLRERPLTLDAVARYPIITYEAGFNARSVIDEAFVEAGLAPQVVLSAIDADVSKAYVELGLGIAILASIAFDRKRDAALRRIDASHLFRPSALCVVLRKGSYLRRYMSDFIQAFAPTLTAAEIECALAGKQMTRSARQLTAL
ncbi:MAG TPA: LysR substrate-binding domain-containing protein [Acidobacteriaceae bacterium]|nr:LysR substrate-binding domain-containing protein [Acidobacteriaceae bacterium]